MDVDVVSSPNFFLREGDVWTQANQNIIELVKQNSTDLPLGFGVNIWSSWLVHKSPKTKTKIGRDVFHFFCCQIKYNN